jgi:nitrate reductase gamma subunit
MSGSILVPFAWGAVAFFLIGIACRTVALARLPAHLRWELAPIPHEKRRAGYGGSYLEEYEWWKRARKKSTAGPLLRMAAEIFLLRGVWRHNRSLWPFSFAMHLGIYLSLGALLFHAVLVLRSHGSAAAEPAVLLKAASATALAGYLLGAAGTAGLLLKRLWEPELRWSSSTGAFVNLLFLATVFTSGAYAWFRSPNAASEVGVLISGVFGPRDDFTVAFPLALHGTLVLLLAVYLPFTGMIHFIAKYFTYHRVLWNDEPMNGRLERRFRDLLTQTMDWEAEHAGKGKSWAELAKAETGGETKDS